MAIRLITGRLQQRSRYCADWNRSDMHLTFGIVGVARVRCSYENGVHEWRWPTQAQLMRSDILRNIDVLGKDCLWSFGPLSPRGRRGSIFLCLVSALVIRPVLLCSVIWRFVLFATRSGYHQLS